MKPFISIVIPVYNTYPYLRNCLCSVKNQTFTDWECICINDGSTDGSDEILEEFAGKDKRFKVVQQRNAGVGSARNHGIKISTGEWIMFLDSDDTWDLELLFKLRSRVLERPSCDAVCFGVVINGGSSNDEQKGEFPPPATMLGDEILRNGRGVYNYCIWSSCDKIYKLSTLRNLKLSFNDKMLLCEDSLFVQKFLALCGEIIVDCSILGYNYTMRDGSATHIKQLDLPRNPFVEFEELYDIWLKNRKPGLKVRLTWLAASYFSLGKNDIYTKDVRSKAVNLLLESKYFNRDILLFLINNGSVKARLVSIVYAISPRLVKKFILERV